MRKESENLIANMEKVAAQLDEFARTGMGDERSRTALAFKCALQEEGFKEMTLFADLVPALELIRFAALSKDPEEEKRLLGAARDAYRAWLETRGRNLP